MNRNRTPVYIAIGISAALVLWMGSGLVFRGDKEEHASSAQQARPLFRVKARQSTATLIERESRVNARTEANRSVNVRAEVGGQVLSVGAQRGADIAEGGVIVELEARDRLAALARAEAALRQQAMETQSTEKLAESGLASQAQLAAQVAALEAAKAALTLARLDVDRSTIRSPFDAVLVDRSVEVGDYLNIGDAVALVSDLDPIRVGGFMTEREIAGVGVGSVARAILSDGTEIAGSISYLSPEADPVTRMYRVEMESANAGGAIRAGMTAQLFVPHEKVMAHHVSPAQISLNNEGELGVVLVDEDGVTNFAPVSLVMTEPDGIWVSGLPDEVTIVTAGKDFVSPGQRVEVVLEQAE